MEAFRRGYLSAGPPPAAERERLPWYSPGANPNPPSPPPERRSSPPLLENALNYLSGLRSCTIYEDVLSNAIETHLATKEFFSDKHDDFVTDLDSIPAVAVHVLARTRDGLRRLSACDNHHHHSSKAGRASPTGRTDQPELPRIRSPTGLDTRSAFLTVPWHRPFVETGRQ